MGNFEKNTPPWYQALKKTDPLRKWNSNDHDLKESILKSERDFYGETLHVIKSENKVLGVKWNSSDDKFIFGVEGVVENAMKYDGPITKRHMLKTTASHYDPIGILSPILVQFKCIIQEAYRMKLSWDAEVDDELAEKWRKLLRNCAKLEPFIIERNYLCQRNLCDVKDMQLHGFADASGKAYACVIYLRVLFDNGEVFTTFVASKSRVAPIKKITIPRLELMACLILSNLMNTVIKSFTDYVINDVVCWTDNTDCLYWIHSRKKVWPRFIQNRVKDIRENISALWRFCPGVDNPADIPSRGLELRKPETREKWLRGPQFLISSSDNWPIIPELAACDVEKFQNNEKIVSVNVKPVAHNNDLIIDEIIEKHSFHSFKKLVLITSYVLRFIDNCKRVIKKRQLKIGEISIDERMHAKRLWLINEQSQINDKQMNQLKISLGAYRDEDSVIKLKGRLEHADLNMNSKFPILIPKGSYIGDLIIMDAHKEVLHYGMKDTLNQVRTEYWIIQGRSRVKTVLNKCYLCRKFEGKLLKMLPAAPLPDFRVMCCDPFTHVGVDYLGPLHVYPTPSHKKDLLEKVHVVLFTCASTRAVHLDMVPDTSCSAFISCLKRFFGRRGFPKLFISDNAKCFIAAELKRFLKIREIEWQFILEVSPWWGGFYERMIQTVKRSLRKTLRRNNASYDELMTILIEIEAVINCRPLCYLYSDEAEEVLTPSHLILGRRLLSPRCYLPVKISDENERTMNNRLKYLNSLISHYETKWKKEYLTELREFHKNHNRLPAKQINVGDVVLIEEEGLPRCRWRLGKVHELMKSKDGYIRGCRLRVYNENRKLSFLNRPVNKLCFFEVACADDEN